MQSPERNETNRMQQTWDYNCSAAAVAPALSYHFSWIVLISGPKGPDPSEESEIKLNLFYFFCNGALWSCISIIICARAQAHARAPWQLPPSWCFQSRQLSRWLRLVSSKPVSRVRHSAEVAREWLSVNLAITEWPSSGQANFKLSYKSWTVVTSWDGDFWAGGAPATELIFQVLAHIMTQVPCYGLRYHEKCDIIRL